MKHTFLPICKQDMEDRGWQQLDFVYISGDAYVDHPSLGHAIITRIFGITWVQGRHHLTTGLEKTRWHCTVWGAEAGFSGVFRKYGLHGKSLFGVKKTSCQ